MNIVGLDVSTSCTGFVIVDDNEKLLRYKPITFEGCETIWQKADKFEEVLKQETLNFKVEKLFVEQPLMMFNNGSSSAYTISKLTQFNGIVCFIARKVLGVDPVHVNVMSVRKACGIKIVKNGKNHKDQTFDWITQHQLKDVTFPTKKSGAVQNWAKDVVDAYVTAIGGLKLPQEV